MKRKCLFISMIFIAVSLTASSGAFAVCVERQCMEGMYPGDCLNASMEYDNCVKQEKKEKEARKKQEQLEKGEEAVKEPASSIKTNYPFLDDIREINKNKKY